MWRNTQERSIYVYTHSYNIWCSLSSTLQESKAERRGSSVYVQVVKLSQQWQQLLFLLKAVGSRLKDTRARIERGRQGKLVQTFFFFFCHTKKMRRTIYCTSFLTGGLSWLILESCALSGKKDISIHSCILSLTNSFCCLHQIIKKPHRNKKKKSMWQPFEVTERTSFFISSWLHQPDSLYRFKLGGFDNDRLIY